MCNDYKFCKTFLRMKLKFAENTDINLLLDNQVKELSHFNINWMQSHQSFYLFRSIKFHLLM